MSKKRMIVLIGAGASRDYGAPLTKGLSEEIEGRVHEDDLLARLGGVDAFDRIKKRLADYLQETPNFEQIYHCAHELLANRAPSTGSADEFRPLLYPFVEVRETIDDSSLKQLLGAITQIIFDRIALACENPKVDLGSLTRFIDALRQEYVTRIYTTNYDDFILQAAPDLFTGFGDDGARQDPRRFQLDRFWEAGDRDSVFHLHGSVHLAAPAPPVGDLHELCWLDDRREAMRYARFDGSGARRMDGTQFRRAPILTGLDKLSRIQERPFAHFYAGLAVDLMRADGVFVIGSGLADLHLNTWLKEARSRERPPPILFVDWWEQGFVKAGPFSSGRKEIDMFDVLGIRIRDEADADELGNGWVVARDGSAAVWERGFQAFLKSDKELEDVVGRLGGLKA